jgi:hypothetical protein
MEVSHTDISSWLIKKGERPVKGTRPNMVVEKPSDGIAYFFKESKKNNRNEDIMYPSEIWSEIIASKIGKLAGFDVLDYNIATLKNEGGVKLGCLSQSMVNQDTEQLVHGIDMLTDYTDFINDNNKPESKFELFERLCRLEGKNGVFLNRFLDIIIFDALVGNTDRHLENWAFISPSSVRLSLGFRFSIGIVKFILRWRHKEKPKDYNPFIDFTIKRMHGLKFAPIYDSGSCLGRELPENRLVEYLKKKDNIDRFVTKGMSEITWQGKKMGFFDLISEVKKSNKAYVTGVINRVLGACTNEKIENIVYNADASLQGVTQETCLSQNRKKFIVELLKARRDKLKGLLDG